ncbi:MAG TPA: DNA repair protein RadC, partial [Candidatus Paceibacterota bacterium]
MKTSTYTLKDNNLFLDNSLREYVLKIRDLPLDDKPREKLIKQGPDILSIQELLAIILNVGSKNEDIMEMSSRIIREYGERSILAEKNAKKLSLDLNIPLIKACQIIACGELGRRFYEKNISGFTVIRTAKDAYEYLRDMHNLPKEHLRGLYLNSHNRIIHDEVISIGTINTNIVHPREVFRPAIEYSAAAVVLAHNHPSGNVTPSAVDIEITKQLV